MGRRLGQHFLHDRHVLGDIVAAAGLRAGEPVLEIGPGEAALTERLLAAGVRLVAVEVDPALAGRLEARFAEAPAFRVVRADVLKADLSPEALFGTPEPYAVVANLPYYLSTPLLMRMVSLRQAFTRLVLMVQKEVALRMAASPAGGKTYGSLSVAAQYAFDLEVVRTVPPGAFRPPPKVDSAVVRLVPRPSALPAPLESAFLEHVKMLFARRRKLMRSGLQARLAPLDAAQRAEVAAIVGERRPEALGPAEHLAVFRLLNGLPASG